MDAERRFDGRDFTRCIDGAETRFWGISTNLFPIELSIAWTLANLKGKRERTQASAGVIPSLAGHSKTRPPADFNLLDTIYKLLFERI
jgi:hypothetical protein